MNNIESATTSSRPSEREDEGFKYYPKSRRRNIFGKVFYYCEILDVVAITAEAIAAGIKYIFPFFSNINIEFLKPVEKYITMEWFLLFIIILALFYVAEEFTNIPEFMNEINKNRSFIARLSNKFENDFKLLEDSSISTIRTCTNFIDNLFNNSMFSFNNWSKISKVSNKQNDIINSLGANVKAWSDKILSSLNIEEEGNKYITNTWLTYFETYFREEAFDVKRNELVTNGRNYPFLLLNTLSTLLDLVPKGKFLHYYAVTPVVPKDWFNWPHGNKRPYQYYEADFLCLYHDSLSELLCWAKKDNKLVHSRFILTEEEPDPSYKKNIFGWKLDRFKNFEEDIKECSMLNFSIPIYTTAQQDYLLSNGLSSLYSYYKLISDFQPSHFNPNNHNTRIHIVPILSDHWCNRISKYKKKDNIAYRDPDVLSDIEESLKALRSIDKNQDTLNQLKDFTLKNTKDEIEIFKKEILSCDINDIKTKINSLTEKIYGFDYISLPEEIQSLHKISLELSIKKTLNYDVVKQYLISILRYRTIQRAQPVFQKLGTVFSTNLHSQSENSFVVSLINNALDDRNDYLSLKKWVDYDINSDKIEPEFAIFGISDKQDCNIDNFDEIDWHLGLSTDINYPFEVAKINIFTKGSKLAAYSNVIKSFMMDYNNNPNKNVYRIEDIVNGKI